MTADSYIALGGFMIALFSFLGYVVTRFARVETDVSHLQRDIEEFHEVKQMIYKIHAQNELILQMENRSK